MRWRDHFNPKYMQISVYVIITCVVIYIFARVADNIGDIVHAVSVGLKWMGVLFRPLFWGIFLSYVLHPVMHFVKKQLEKTPYYKKKGKSALGLAVAITVIGMLLAVTLLLSLLVSTLTRDIRLANLDDIENMINSLARTLNSFYYAVISKMEEMNISSEELNTYLSQVTDSIGNVLRGYAQNILGSMNHLQSFFTNFLFSVIFGIYFLLDGEGLLRYWKRVLKALASQKFYHRIAVLVQDADHIFSGYIRGQLLDALFMGIVVSIVLRIMNVKFSVIIGILTGIGNLIPYMGPFLAYGSTVVVCLVNGDIPLMIISIIVLFIIQTIDGNVVNPRLLAQNISIHPMLVIASLIIGSALGGIVGMLFAVPVGALLKMQFDRLIDFLIRKRHLEDDAVQPELHEEPKEQDL